MKIKKGDKILVVRGKDRGKTGKVSRTDAVKNKLVVEGINLHKKHVKPKKSGEKGQRVEVAAPLSISNVKIICPKCGKAARIGVKILETKEKVWVCKKCKQKF